MAHTNLSPRINRILDSRGLPYVNLIVGETLVFTAASAITGQNGTFSVQVVGMLANQTTPIPVLQFRGGGIALFGHDRTAIRLPAGTLALGGYAARHIPHFVLSMVGYGGFEITGRDHSFEFVGGEPRCVYAHCIQNIVQHSAPKGWRPPQETVNRYLAAYERAKREQNEADARRKLRMKRAMTVRTANSTYLIGEADESGKRTLLKQGQANVINGTLIVARVGGSLIFQLDRNELVSSTVIGIDPDPDAAGGED